MNIYLDESGDLGWTFEKPYRKGGSSRYLTIAALIVPKPLSYLPKRIVKKIYSRRRMAPVGGRELKGNALSREEKIRFSKSAVKLLTKEPSIKVCAITVRKENVLPHIQRDPNKLYNYMVHFLLLEKIRGCSAVDFIPDPRTIKVESGNSLVDYLQIKLWFELNCATIIRRRESDSSMALNLQFVDFIAHIFWSRYEDNESASFNVLRSSVESKHLFF